VLSKYFNPPTFVPQCNGLHDATGTFSRCDFLTIHYSFHRSAHGRWSAYVIAASETMASKTSGWLFRGLFRTKPVPVPKSAPAADPFHAVSIIPGEHACAVAYRSTGQRFLSPQAPKLPLPTCDAFHCTCRFKHHKDRRAGPRRRSDIGLMSGRYPGTE
jgi:hypothetical protein